MTEENVKVSLADIIRFYLRKIKRNILIKLPLKFSFPVNSLRCSLKQIHLVSGIYFGLLLYRQEVLFIFIK